ncbi:acVLRF1 family peptidyl-tRNA hydrolase [Psychromicrobium sp. YIM B11713]|uniref:acVLRF1 family peptidyl-tRNA hydrolase n=1 Tax=Psychromicrobium sp. YIM B11713 TaxID=3145233 RepID=UPI00374E5AE9
MTRSQAPAARTAWVTAQRLSGWVQRFEASHGELAFDAGQQALRITAQDGAVAELTAPWPVDGRPGRGSDEVTRLASLSAQSRTLFLLLIRRGGYALAVCREGEVLNSKIGTRYVQSRTAAGGWSQQRFARRRANQADAMIEAVAAHAAKLPSADCEYLLLGGDKAMATALLAEPVLSAVAALPQLAFLDVPDPKAKVLAEAARKACSVRIRVSDSAVCAP